MLKNLQEFIELALVLNRHHLTLHHVDPFSLTSILSPFGPDELIVLGARIRV